MGKGTRLDRVEDARVLEVDDPVEVLQVAEVADEQLLDHPRRHLRELPSEVTTRDSTTTVAYASLFFTRVALRLELVPPPGQPHHALRCSVPLSST